MSSLNNHCLFGGAGAWHPYRNSMQGRYMLFRVASLR